MRRSVAMRAAALAMLVSSLYQLPATAQRNIHLELAGGASIPALTDWASFRAIGPNALIGVTGYISEHTGWVVRAGWNRFTYRRSSVETTDYFTSEPPGEVIQVSVSEVEGGAFSTFTGTMGIRRVLHRGTTSDTYLTGGLVIAGTSQEAATALYTTTTDSSETSERGPFQSENSDWGIGLTVRLTAAFHLSEGLAVIGEFGYEVLYTPDDSFADNPDYLPIMLGIRKAL